MLDFQNNTISIGVNAAGPSAKNGAKGIDDHHPNNEEQKSSSTFLVFFFLILGAIISYFVYKRYKEDKEQN